MSGVLSDIKYIPVTELPKRKKPIKSRQYPKEKISRLSETERILINLIDKQHLSFSVIAQSIGCKRQYIHQEYHKAIDKIAG